MTSEAEVRSALRRPAIVALLALAATVVPWLAAVLLPPLAQPQSYHDFADQRTLWGIPHALNVVSNLAFVVVGGWGLSAIARGSTNFDAAAAARLGWLIMFSGITLTGAGSAYYHLDPSDATLVWDRLPMAFGFAGLVAGTLTDRAPQFGGPMLVALMSTAIGSVVAWAIVGDLVPYLAVQVSYAAVALLATVLIRSPYTHARWLIGGLALYAGAVVCERLDRQIDVALGGAVSGHTLKHLLAAAAALAICRMLQVRARQA